MGEKNPFSVDYIAPGVIAERSFDKTLLIFSIENASSTTLDAWLNEKKSMLVNWSTGNPCLLLNHIHKIGVNNSLYKPFEALYQSCPHWKRYTV